MPYINQLNVQGNLYDLYDKRLADSQIGIVISDNVVFDGGVDFEEPVVFNNDALLGSDNIATEPWVLQQLSGISIDNVLTLQGTISPSTASTILAAAHEAGDVYIVTTAGTIAGQVCEVGDLLICTEDFAAGASADSKWTVAQTNLDSSGLMRLKNGPYTIDSEEDIVQSGHRGDVYFVSEGQYFFNTEFPQGGIVIAVSDYGAYDEQNPTALQNTFMTIPSGSAVSVLAGQDNQIAVYSGQDNIVGRTLAAGTGLSIATTSSLITINHSNSVTAGAFGPSASASALSFALPYVQYDAQGHISSVASFTHTIPTFAPATSSSAGQAGVLPAMSSMTSEQETWVLYANGTWGPQLGSGDEGYTLPLAADGTRGGLQVGYATDRASGYFAVQLSSEKAYVAVPTFTGATSSANGEPGLVPQSLTAASQTFLRADGAWSDVAYVSSNILYI